MDQFYSAKIGGNLWVYPGKEEAVAEWLNARPGVVAFKAGVESVGFVHEFWVDLQKLVDWGVEGDLRWAACLESASRTVESEEFPFEKDGDFEWYENKCIELVDSKAASEDVYFLVTLAEDSLTLANMLPAWEGPSVEWHSGNQISLSVGTSASFMRANGLKFSERFAWAHGYLYRSLESYPVRLVKVEVSDSAFEVPKA